MTNKHGFTLIEFMLANIFGLILITGIISIYINQKQSYKYQKALSEVQDNMRIINNLLMNDIHSAGSTACLSMNNINIISSNENVAPFDAEHAAHGFSKNNIFVIAKKNMADGSDALLLESTDPKFYLLNKNMKKSNGIIINRENPYKMGNWLLITDCHESEVAQIAKISNAKYESVITFSEPLKMHYEKNAMVSQIHAHLYYIAQTDQKNNFGDAIYSLHKRDLFDAINLQDEYIDGIDNLHLTFTIKENDGKSESILTSKEVSMQHAWTDVVAINIKLLISSVTPVYAEHKVYIFDDKKHDGDHTLHKEIDFSVARYNQG